MMMRTFLTAGLMALISASAQAQLQPHYCPDPGDVWVVETEFPDAPGWRHAARVRGNNLDGSDRMRRPIPSGRITARPATSPRGQSSTPTANRPLVAPMLTHDRAVSIRESTDPNSRDLPPVIAVLDWVRVETRSSSLVCRYSLDDGASYGRHATVSIPINRRDCLPLHNNTAWSYDSNAGGEVCNEARTSCQFYCSAERVLESW
ncbi:hypothetical protein [uncultured Maricaulis sp.]|uniref:hypothetical protein n=1 Tax=uncultured Maricaulis sp. TaxID=174710 RepID=UPI0025EE6592|nr:hypothetical protein [uncultured Maricaulis sp.]